MKNRPDGRIRCAEIDAPPLQLSPRVAVSLLILSALAQACIADTRAPGDTTSDVCATDAGRAIEPGATFVAHLDGFEAIPPHLSPRGATAELVIDQLDLDGNGYLDANFSITVDYPDPVGEMAADFFLATSRCETTGRFLTTARMTTASVEGTLASFGSSADYEALSRGGMYLVLRTTNFPSGELRGWFERK